MADPPESIRSTAFVIRVRRDRGALRGQVMAVANGAARLFEDLNDAMAFIRAQVEAGASAPAPGPADPNPKRR